MGEVRLSWQEMLPGGYPSYCAPANAPREGEG
jgi:hypothetical protein